MFRAAGAGGPFWLFETRLALSFFLERNRTPPTTHQRLDPRHATLSLHLHSEPEGRDIDPGGVNVASRGGADPVAGRVRVPTRRRVRRPGAQKPRRLGASNDGKPRLGIHTVCNLHSGLFGTKLSKKRKGPMQIKTQSVQTKFHRVSTNV